jgi:outer membrane protein TolC
VLSVIGACASVDTSSSLRGATSADTAVALPARTVSPARSGKVELPDLDESAGLEEYLAYAALNNPGLQAAFHRWKAELERVPQVTALPDPRFTYRYFIREVETRVGPQQQALGLAQTFPWLGKLALRGDMASEAARAARQQYEARKLQLFYKVRDAYYEYYYLGRSISVVEQTLELVKHLESVARTRFRAAAASHPDVIRAQVELGKLEDQLKALRDFRTPLVARLNAALNRRPGEDLPVPRTIPADRMAAGDEQILEWFSESSPELRALDHEIERARHAIELARKDYYPDLTFGFDYTDVGSPPSAKPQGLANPGALRSLSRIGGGMGDLIDAYAIGRSFRPGDRPDDAGRDVWMVSMSMNVPIWRDKYAAGEREARARHLAARHARKQRENVLAAKIQRVLYDYRDAERKIDLYRDTLVPKARQSLRSTEASFRAGTSSFLDLIDAERTLLDFELSYERASTNRAQRLAELEKLVGRSIPRMGDESSAKESAGESPEGRRDGTESDDPDE